MTAINPYYIGSYMGYTILLSAFEIGLLVVGSDMAGVQYVLVSGTNVSSTRA